jgi:hypothetical protein
VRIKDTPTPQQVAALARWKATNGWYWKSKLLDAWMKSGERVSGYEPELQQLRNAFGPSWLMKQR